MPIDDRVGREDGRFDFEKIARGEKCPQPVEYGRSKAEIVPSGRGAKVVGHDVS
jgi:hypothetical protein